MNIDKMRELKLEDQVEINDEKLKKSELYKEKGNELFKKSLYDDALDYYFKSITLNPKDHRCYGNIGQILINKGRYAEAKEVLEAAIELNSNYTKAFYRLGLVEKYLKNYDEALLNFDRVLKLEPNNKATIKECEEIQKSLGLKKIEASQNVKRVLSEHNETTAKESDLNKKSNLSSGVHISTNSIKSSSSLKSDSASSKSNLSTIKKSTAKQPNKLSIRNISFPKIEIPFKLPDSSPKTSYQFNVFWKEIKHEQQKIEYLRFVGAQNFQKIFQKNLEPDFLSELIALFTLMDKDLVLDFLNAITQIENFDFSLMFLSTNEKNTLRQIIDLLDAKQLITLYKV